MATSTPPIPACDVLVVGAGIVGLAHAMDAVARGLSVVVIDRDAWAVGASVRNFGHCCVTAQSGELLELAQVSRERWLHYSGLAGFFSIESGAIAVAANDRELDVLTELAESREPGQVRLLDALGTRARLSVGAATTGDRSAIVGGAVLRDDLRVDPREAVSSLAAWLADQPGVTFHWRTSFFGAADGVAETSRGAIRAEQTIVCVGHDLDYLYPDLALQHEIRRCGLQMARVEPPAGLVIAEAVLTGTSMLRYPAFTETAAAGALRTHLDAADPALLEIDANLMFTQRPDGTLIVGDSHRYGSSVPPFLAEPTSDLLLDRVAAVLGVESLRVLERWQGVYASSPQHPYLVHELRPGVTVVAVTSGVGMTISLGLARKVMGALY
ncbi:TIGR03364 family FAD-dependent oxidoreductase [Lacisediminihabitans sp.]|jgi:FAD dependent oxidoreductase TIGR03364|uniref:TIGR03364 family FAD-dependent oxidoreductase n=1 Tax=Lacisediminihabitans sp. TaxID=2787631 RepID=UPI002F935190